jgi:hypothetical protein
MGDDVMPVVEGAGEDLLPKRDRDHLALFIAILITVHPHSLA